MQASTICTINQKGGCGKSSTCFHLAGQLAKNGDRVLLVDADPQGSLSQGFFGSELVESLAPEQTLAAVFDDDVYLRAVTDLIVSTDFENVDIIRANHTLSRHNLPEPELSGMKQFLMQTELEQIDHYDFILIDCPPTLYQCSWNAMLASQFVVIPVMAEDFAMQGLRPVREAIARAKELNPKLEILGQLITKYDRRLGVHRRYEKILRKVYGDEVFRTIVPEAVAFKDALTLRKPVAHHSSWSRANKQMKLLSKEVARRVNRSTNHMEGA